MKRLLLKIKFIKIFIRKVQTNLKKVKVLVKKKIKIEPMPIKEELMKYLIL